MIRPHHPFEGQTLELLGWSHRSGRLHLLLILPDKSRSHIPAEWTDLKPPPKIKEAQQDDGIGNAQNPRLCSLSQLLKARALVDALLCRPESTGDANQKPPTQEGSHATVPELSADPTSARRGVGTTQ
ncbi:MAG: hypothetical protein GY809_16930 [Planctomycetes bacterium]|nr:hypothetical protein [Planctomycetota bacterium]